MPFDKKLTGFPEIGKLAIMASLQHEKVGSLSPRKLESIIDDTAARFGKLCEDLYKKAAWDLATPDMKLEALIKRSVSRALLCSPVMEQQGESVGPPEPGESVGPPAPEPTFAVYIKDEEMEDTA